MGLGPVTDINESPPATRLAAPDPRGGGVSLDLAVVGLGYVGLTTAAALAAWGHRVWGMDRDPRRVRTLVEGTAAGLDPDLDLLVRSELAGGRLRLGTDLGPAAGAAAVFVAVPTPAGPSGRPDLSALWAVAGGLEQLEPPPRIVVIRSTVPVGTGDDLARRLGRLALPPAVISNPEFLREGTALRDFRHPHRVVIGAADPEAAAVLASIYRSTGAPVILTDRPTAELVKYASNAYLAMRVSFANELADYAARAGLDVAGVLRAAGMDPRIGLHYLGPGLGFGGPCLPKDLDALRWAFRRQGLRPRLLDAARQVNRERVRSTVSQLQDALGGLGGRAVAVWGLAFKGGTADARQSPAVALVRALVSSGARVTAYDPAAGPVRGWPRQACRAADLYSAAKGAHALVIATDWPEFGRADLERVRSLLEGDLILDARRLLSPAAVQAAGLKYAGPGYPPPGGPLTAAR